jgi:putative transposase
LITCIYCGSNAIVKYGKYRQSQRYWCKSCRKKFRPEEVGYYMKTASKEISRSLSLYYCGTGVEDIRRVLEDEYSHTPAKRTIFNWIEKYSALAAAAGQGSGPVSTGSTWIADETVIRIRGQKVQIFDIQDEKSRFLLATQITPASTTGETRTFLEQAYQKAGLMPSKIITDSYISYLIEAENGPLKNTRPVQENLFSLETDPQRIVPFHATLRDRTTVLKRLKSIASAEQFNRSWLVYYNFFRAHEALNGKTPAEQAGIDAPLKNWADIIASAH